MTERNQQVTATARKLAERLSAAFDQIHDAMIDSQRIGEDRRHLAADIGELIRQLVDDLIAIGWSEQDARQVNVHDLAQTV